MLLLSIRIIYPWGIGRGSLRERAYLSLTAVSLFLRLRDEAEPPPRV